MALEQHVSENYDQLVAERGVDSVRDFAVKAGYADIVAYLDEKFGADVAAPVEADVVETAAGEVAPETAAAR